MAAQLKPRYTDKQKAKAIALFEAGNTLASVARQMKIPKSTLHAWKEQYAKDKGIVFKIPERKTEQPDTEKTLEFIEQVEAFKKEFAASAQNVVQLATELAERRLKRAVDQEAAIDKAIEMTGQDEELTYAQKKEIINQLKQIKVEDISKLSVVAGTFYDKQALANKEATSIIDGNITVKKFEDF